MICTNHFEDGRVVSSRPGSTDKFGLKPVCGCANCGVLYWRLSCRVSSHHPSDNPIVYRPHFRCFPGWTSLYLPIWAMISQTVLGVVLVTVVPIHVVQPHFFFFDHGKKLEPQGPLALRPDDLSGRPDPISGYECLLELSFSS